MTQLRVFKNTLVSTNTVSGHTLSLVANPPLPDETVLQVGNRTFTVDTDSDGSTRGHEQWDTEDDPLNWTDGQHVTTSLKVFTESADATLSALSIIGETGGETITLSPAFNADTFTYTASVPNRFDSVKLTATANESNATVAITSDDDTNTPDTADLDLTVGANTLTVTVTAEDGTVLAYAITATRATTPPAPTDCPTLTTWCTTMGAGYWTDNGVSAKSESWGYNKLESYGDLHSTTFSHDGNNYTVSDVFRAKVASPDGNNVDSDLLTITTSPELPDDTVLQLGSRTFTVGTDSDFGVAGSERWDIEDAPVVWTDGQHVTTSLKLAASDDATLSALSIEGAPGGETITLSPTFNANTFTYTAAVPNRFDSVKLTATANESNASIAITNDDDTTTPAEADLDLTVGANTLTVTVTAESTTTQAHTITVTRAAQPPVPTDCPTDTDWCTTMGVGYLTGTSTGIKNEFWEVSK